MRLEHVSAAYLLGLPTLPGIDYREAELLHDFLHGYRDAFATYSVNVPVGPGDVEAASLGAAVDRMWAAITRRRIDLVIEGTRTAVIVEAKVHARMRAATQVLRYADLYAREHPSLALVRPLIVCRSHVPGIDRVLEPYLGGVVVVPPLPAREDVAS
ncbi:MAG TPA: hypothetical protein VJN96_15220 [Vicinamibacterales bacterium]|nr:hypothetical protein [Vicinamibacterales bacterium]